jgi:hypothetical protein
MESQVENKKARKVKIMQEKDEREEGCMYTD